MKSIIKLCLATSVMAYAAAPSLAEDFSFTVVAGHPPITKGVAGIRDFFIPEVNRRLAPVRLQT